MAINFGHIEFRQEKNSTHSSKITNAIINSISSRLNEIQKTNLIKLDEWLDIKCSVNVGVYEGK